MGTTLSAPRNQSALPILILGIVVLLVEGYDLFVFGAIAPVLLEYEAWNVSPALIGIIGGLPPLAAPVGAVAAGYAADMFGRRLPMIVSLTWLSVCMFGSFVAPTLGVFMATRLAAGLALGSLIPLTLAAVADQAPPRRSTLYTCAALTGIGGGGIVASLLGRVLLPGLQFQYMFLFGCVPLLLLPVVWRLIPSSGSTVAGQEAAGAAGSAGPIPAEPAVAGSGSGPQVSKLRQLFAPGLAGPTLGFWIASFVGLVLSFGVAIWLPTLMVESGYALNSSLEFALAFSIGAVVGTLLVALVAERWSLKWVTVACFGVAFISVFVMSTPQPRPLLFVMAAFAGLGAPGAQNLITAYVVNFYPARIRGTGLGFSQSVGRLGAIAGPVYIGAVVALVNIPNVGFYAFMIPALLGALVVAMIPERQRAVTPDATAAESPGARVVNPK